MYFNKIIVCTFKKLPSISKNYLKMMCFDQNANFRWKITLYLLYNIQRGNNVFLNMISRYNIYLFGINIISKIQNNWLKNAAGRNKKRFQHYPRLDISGGTCVMFTRENNGDLWARPQLNVHARTAVAWESSLLVRALN